MNQLFLFTKVFARQWHRKWTRVIFHLLISELESQWQTLSQPWKSGCWPVLSLSSSHWLSMQSFSERKSSAKETKEKLWAIPAQHSLSWRRKICQTQRAFKASIIRFKSRRKLCRSADEILIQFIILLIFSSRWHTASQRWVYQHPQYQNSIYLFIIQLKISTPHTAPFNLKTLLRSTGLTGTNTQLWFSPF